MKKKLWLVLLALAALSLFAGCAGSADGMAQGPEGSLEEILEQIYEKKNTGLELETVTVDLSDADMVKRYTGLDSADLISEAVASEPMINAQAYSMVLVRVANEKDTASVAAAMKEGIDQRKWICVEADDLRVAADGDVIMLFMVTSDLSDTVTAQDMVDAFREICGGTLSVE